MLHQKIYRPIVVHAGNRPHEVVGERYINILVSLLQI